MGKETIKDVVGTWHVHFKSSLVSSIIISKKFGNLNSILNSLRTQSYHTKKDCLVFSQYLLCNMHVYQECHRTIGRVLCYSIVFTLGLYTRPHWSCSKITSGDMLVTSVLVGGGV